MAPVACAPDEQFDRRRDSLADSHRSRAAVSTGAAIAVGAAIGLALGIGVSVATELPLAPEVGLALGALVGWLSRRDSAPR